MSLEKKVEPHLFDKDSLTRMGIYGTIGLGVTGASILAATGAATLAATTGILIAFGPLAAVIVVGAGVAMLLEIMDERYKFTDKIISALDEISEKGISAIIEESKQKIINKVKSITDNAVDSVIDYAVEKVEDCLRNVVNQLMGRLSLPKT